MNEPAIFLSAIFHGDPAAAVAAAKIFHWRVFERGDSLFRQGDDCAHCWFIVDGAAALSSISENGQHVRLAAYGPGELVGAYPAPRIQFGEMVCDRVTRALEAATIELASLAGRDPAIGGGLATLFARQHESLLTRMANQLALSASGRVYSELLAMADEDGRIQPPPVVAAVALRANTARETASRAIAAAERRGLLAKEGDALLIASPARLQALVI